MIDFFRNPPELKILIDMVIEHNMKLINKWLEIGVDVMYLGDDLGTQTGLMMSPKLFRKYLKPGYAQMMGACRAAGAHVHFHSDGHILEIVDDLIECGVTILNVEAGANGLDDLAKVCKGKVCINLSIDQPLLRFGRPRDVKSHIREAVVKLGSKEGGLMLACGTPANVPLANIEALCEAVEEYQYYFRS